MGLLLLAITLAIVFSLIMYSKTCNENKNIHLINNGLIIVLTLLLNLIDINKGFNIIRLFSLLITSLLFYNVLTKKLFNKTFELNNNLEKYIKLIGWSLILIVFIFSLLNIDKYYLRMPLDYETFKVDKNPYPLLFEGFLDGHLYINIVPDPKLALLENPYAYRPNVDYLWDFCYYNNHYYVYFGVAPVILFYFPIYILTLGNLIPTYELVNIFLFILAFTYSTLAFIRVYKHFKKNISIPIFIIIIISLFICGGYELIALAFDPLYNTPILCGTTFIYILIYYTFKAIEEDKKLSFALVGFAFTVILASRPNLAVIIFPLLVFLIPYLFNNFKKNIINVLPCIITLTIGLSLLGTYNFLRFGNPLDFGSNYQLTVSDVSKNKILLENIPAALYYYLFQPPLPQTSIPYLRICALDIKWFKLSHYTYTYPTIGLFTIPLCLLSFLGFNKNNELKYRWFNFFFILNIFILSIFNFSLAGVHFRYLMDLLPMTIFISLLNIAITFSNIKDNKDIFLGVIFIIIALTIYYFLNLYVNELYIRLNNNLWLKNLIYNLIR